MIASTIYEGGEARDEPGVWGRLVVTRADGGEPEVLTEQFVSDADAEAHVAQQQEMMDVLDPDQDWRAIVQAQTAPGGPVWSPRGDKIAFLAAMPFNPDGVYFRHQTEVWICDLATKELTRITHDDFAQHSLIWLDLEE
jgi:hypothetical protein